MFGHFGLRWSPRRSDHAKCREDTKYRDLANPFVLQRALRSFQIRELSVVVACWGAVPINQIRLFIQQAVSADVIAVRKRFDSTGVPL